MVGIINAPDYARAIVDAALRRRLFALAHEIQERACGTDVHDGDATATLGWTMGEIDRLASEGGTTSQSVGLGGAVDTAIAQAEAAARGDAAATGLMTGIASLDEMWSGLYPGALEIIGARPSTGKSALAMQIARHVAGSGGCVGIVSLEMSAADIGVTNLAAMTGISADEIRKGRADASAMVLARKNLLNLPIEINDTPRLPLREAIAWWRALRRKKGLRLAIADHRNLFGRDPEHVRTPKFDWYQHVTQELKAAAKMLGVPILLLVQISRGVDQRDDPRPRMSDLEYAGEQDADNIVLIHRPELTTGGPPAKKPNETTEAYANRATLFWEHRRSLKGKTEMLFVKRRFGQKGICHLEFDGPRLTFRDPPTDQTLSPDLWMDN